MADTEFGSCEMTAGEGSRQEARLSSGFAVRVVWVDMTDACAGRLKDVSQSGARIVVEGGEKARGDVYVLAHLQGEAEPRRLVAKVRWQVGDTLGVRFDAPIDLPLVHALARVERASAH
ncbi:PilZ domain-containing protein [Hyphomonas sp.]|uniref:PilZ domain-containing protein n=1 Tax=Hyphomonas sp. TaxID=87 RepID=UPI0025C646F2|nr:PilZ domain-containing protein [Hyphomonas sp.]MBI1398571.1 hypothetical protein [Hyphomonas sp.]